MLTAIVALLIGVTGWALGRSRPQVNLVMAVFAVFGAITAHSGMQWAFLDGRLHTVLGDPRHDASPLVVLFIAAGEAVGLWVPLLFIPWAQMASRIWGALYALFAATAAAVAFYFPEDLVALNGILMTPDGPPYLLFVIICVPIAAVGYAAGWMKARDDDDESDRLIDRSVQ